jgi:hypothetical protein
LRGNLRLTNDEAPASHVIEYEDIKFNGSMYATSPYIGKGPAVDMAWDVITYNGMFDIANIPVNALHYPITGLLFSHFKLVPL